MVEETSVYLKTQHETGATDGEKSVAVSAALVARDHARAWPAPENARDWSVGSRRAFESFSGWDPDPCRLTMRTERGVGLRPTNGSELGPGSGLALYMPATEDCSVERGAGGGGRLGSQEG